MCIDVQVGIKRGQKLVGISDPVRDTEASASYHHFTCICFVLWACIALMQLANWWKPVLVLPVCLYDSQQPLHWQETGNV